ncbi:MAG: alpha/beta hydrolase [Bacteroidales bacterium]|nr:alpha/beta hydrolase [Bacteroidales bacterium]MDD2322430.1 alpha/beta hydrolase [Bacteroidales bacterium]MDD3009956.1 alpha/beta hydrolase [Bacteroidales bacterium]MDD3960991.1 alpha/beta hydrolase [Bacteroidales bacterium]MDY0284578.1 alpha/beta hydrolase [Bacteroidales bacterium]
MKNIFLPVLITVLAFCSCSRSVDPKDVIPVPQPELSDHTVYTGTFNDDFIMVDFFTAPDADTICGRYFVYDKRAVVTLDTFLIVREPDNEAWISTRAFKGKVTCQVVVTPSEIEVSAKLSRKRFSLSRRHSKPVILRLSPWHKEFTPYLSGRYAADVFPAYVLHSDVEYGVAEGYWTTFPAQGMRYWDILSKTALDALNDKKLPLTMDIYLPSGDSVKMRPLLVLIHGGGFYVGDKAEPTYLALAHYFVRKGYVVASLNYRMGFRFSQKSVERAGYRAVQDAHGALRFLMHHRDTYGFNPDRIFLAGSSAGAITALNLAFMKDNERPSSSNGGLISEALGGIASACNDFPEEFRIRAIVNMWGAVEDTALIDDDEQVELLHFHGDSDRIVPYRCGLPFENVGGRINRWLMPEMCGSQVIDQIAREKGWKSRLVTFNGFDHMPHINPDLTFNSNFSTIQLETQEFFLENLRMNSPVLEGPVVCDDGDRKVEYRISDMEFSFVNWTIEGGFILRQGDEKVQVVWYGNVPVHRIGAVAVRTSGLPVNLSLDVRLE